jgi:hypothetical protein
MLVIVQAGHTDSVLQARVVGLAQAPVNEPQPPFLVINHASVPFGSGR